MGLEVEEGIERIVLEKNEITNKIKKDEFKNEREKNVTRNMPLTTEIKIQANLRS